jgi:integrase
LRRVATALEDAAVCGARPAARRRWRWRAAWSSMAQEMLGHSSISITADTYTSVLPQVPRAAAQAAADLVPRRPADFRAERPAERPPTDGYA